MGNKEANQTPLAADQDVRRGNEVREVGQATEDEAWASHDADVQISYRGQFVVPFRRRIIAHGADAAQVLKEAAQLTGCKIEDLPLVGIDNPLSDVSH
jgi:hypothetical protein